MPRVGKKAARLLAKLIGFCLVLVVAEAFPSSWAQVPEAYRGACVTVL
jgi:hypothetical protein